MCKVLGVSASGYYRWRSAASPKREQGNAELSQRIQEIFGRHQGRYGAPRVHQVLKKDGWSCSKSKVARLMRREGLCAKYRKRKRPSSWRPEESADYAENRLERKFEASCPGEKWVTDIKYIRTKKGWVYLCVVLYLYSRKAVGWSLREHMQESLVFEALEMAVKRERVKDGMLLHSDRGGQYRSKRYRRRLEKEGIECSMSRKGNCWDNACIESFFGTLKRELVYHRHYATRDDATQDIFEYIEVFYNRQRRHSTLGYHSPAEYEARAAVA